MTKRNSMNFSKNWIVGIFCVVCSISFAGCGEEASIEINQDVIPNKDVPVPDLDLKKGPLWFYDFDSGATAGDLNSYIFVINETMYFMVRRRIPNQLGLTYELWSSDGSASNTRMVKVFEEPSSVRLLTSFKGHLYFLKTTGRGLDIETTLLKINGQTAETTELYTWESGVILNWYPKVVGNQFFMGLEDQTSGNELWVTDGTAVGTHLVKDIVPGPDSGDPQEFFDYNGTLFFNAGDEDHGHELWKSDGTLAGTVMIKDIYPGPTNSRATPRYVQAGKLFFVADDGINGVELWSTDGSSDGTGLFKNISAGPGNSYVGKAADLNGMKYFQANNQLWRSDGTPDGTVMVHPVSDPEKLTRVGNRIFFRADGASGVELWVTDGSTTGTRLLREFNVESRDRPRFLTNVNGNLIFAADDGVHGFELWSSDGTVEGTRMVMDLNPIGDSNPFSFTFFGGSLFFGTLFPETTSNQLWVYRL